MDLITLAHGSGGKLSQQLVRDVFAARFSNGALAKLDDSAVLQLEAGRWAVTTDAFVVDPIFFPCGDIGKLAVCGTVNDLAMVGATPLFLTASFILEEGLPLVTLEKVVESMAEMAREVGVAVVAGDTKVVPKGNADQIFITTTGVGCVPEGVSLSGSNARSGDQILVNGTVGDHGIAVMSAREGLNFGEHVRSDCAPLNGLVSSLLKAGFDHEHRAALHCLRDPTRGGLATVLNEIAVQSNVGIEIDEASVPVSEAVQGACELLGFDPLYLANEGKLVAFVAPDAAGSLLETMRAHPLGRQAQVIGKVTATHPGRVHLRTRIGGSRILDMLVGDQLPRIC